KRLLRNVRRELRLQVGVLLGSMRQRGHAQGCSSLRSGRSDRRMRGDWKDLSVEQLAPWLLGLQVVGCANAPRDAKSETTRPPVATSAAPTSSVSTPKIDAPPVVDAGPPEAA